MAQQESEEQHIKVKGWMEKALSRCETNILRALLWARCFPAFSVLDAHR